MNIKNQITMKKYTYTLIIIASLILSVSIISNVSAYVIDHNNYSVWVQGNYGKLEATPHTLTQSGWVYFNITPYQSIGNIDMVWGFNTTKVKPKKAEFYKPHLVHWTTDHKRFFLNVSEIKYTLDDCCCGNGYNTYKRKITYQTGYNNETNESIMTAETVCFDSYTHNGSNYTAYWHTDHSRLENWIDVSNKFHSINYNYDNKTRWWYVTNFTVESYKTYTGRVWIDVPVTITGISGKYDFAVKRSSDSLHDAISNHRFYLLDPWFNSSWSTKRNLHINYNLSYNLSSTIATIEDAIICNDSGSYSRTDDTLLLMEVYGNKYYRSYVEWNISSIPDDTNISYVSFKYQGEHNERDAHITQMVCKPSTSSNQDIYDDIGNGTVYINQDGFPVVGNNQEIDLGNDAISDLQNALSDDWFAIGLILDNELSDASTTIKSKEGDGIPHPTLYIEYTSESETLNYYQMNLNLSYSDIPEAQPDFDDIRFVNISDNAALPYWVEDRVNGLWCNVWVNVTSLHAGWNNDTMALYYGNSEATSMDDGAAIFNFYDDGEGHSDGDSVATGGWTVDGDTYEYDNSQVYTGSMSLYGNGKVYIAHQNFTNPASDGSAVLEFDMYDNGGTYGATHLKNQDDTESITFGYYSYASSTYYQIYTDAYHSLMDTVTRSTGWHHFKMEVLADGSAEFTIDDNKSSTTAPAGSINNVERVDIRDYDYSDTWWDRIRVRKYAANPPTYILGDAESYTPSIAPPAKLSFTEIDLIDQLHHEYTHIEPETMHIPIYSGTNYISIPLYQYNPTLNAVFDNAVDGDIVQKYVNNNQGDGGYHSAEYYEGYGWYEFEVIEPIEPGAGYIYKSNNRNFTLNVSGYMKYNITIFNYENHVGTNIIRPMRSDKDD